MAATVKRIVAAPSNFTESGFVFPVKNPIAETVGTSPGNL